jgi:nucleoside-triphosphatase THEP1
MQNTYITEGDVLTDEVEINLNMLRTLMLNRVRGEVDCTDIVTIDNNGALERRVKFLQ